ncbi:MAG: hypothetical protein OXR72_02730 [Gemmatimonadota bacterium]|nr:hypothetical protein [Gemmatimonadota bacterium]
MLNWRELLVTTWRLFRLSCRIIFHRKLIFMAMGILVYYAAMYAFAVWRPDEGFGVSKALHVLVEIPGIALAIYLTMDLVAGERDRNTLETLFSTTSSHYRIWTIRMVGVYLVLAGTLMGMTVVAYYFFAELPILRGGFNAFLPACFAAGLTFYFSVVCRSGNAAAMLATGVMGLTLVASQSMPDSPFVLFLESFDPPVGMEDTLWGDRVLLNRLAVALLSGLLLYAGLRKMESRERLVSS